MQQEQLKKYILPALQSKLFELHHCGYQQATLEQLWTYFIRFKWSPEIVAEMPIHQLIHEILHTSINDFMHYRQVKTGEVSFILMKRLREEEKWRQTMMK